MGRLAEALVAQRALVRLLPCVDPLVPGELRQVLEGFLADGAAIGLFGLFRGGHVSGRRRRGQRWGGSGGWLSALGWLVGLVTDGALHHASVGAVVLGQ